MTPKRFTLEWYAQKYQELSEENEKLKEDNKILNRINDKVNGWNGLAHDKIFKLEKENKQLKQFIQELTTKGTGRIDLANGYSYRVNAILTDFNR